MLKPGVPMIRLRFMETQMVSILKEADAVKELSMDGKGLMDR